MESRVNKIFTQLEERKKANASNKFRSFMQTQKADLTQMAVKKDDTVLVEKNISAAAGDTGLA